MQPQARQSRGVATAAVDAPVVAVVHIVTQQPHVALGHHNHRPVLEACGRVRAPQAGVVAVVDAHLLALGGQH